MSDVAPEIKAAVYQAAAEYGVNEPYLTYLKIQWGLQRKLTFSEIVLIEYIMQLTEWILHGHAPMGD